MPTQVTGSLTGSWSSAAPAREHAAGQQAGGRRQRRPGAIGGPPCPWLERGLGGWRPDDLVDIRQPGGGLDGRYTLLFVHGAPAATRRVRVGIEPPSSSGPGKLWLTLAAGTYYHLAVYDRALSSAEVARIYAQGYKAR